MRVLFYIGAMLVLFSCNVSEPAVETEKVMPASVASPGDTLIDTVKAYTSAIKAYINEFCKTNKPDTLFLSRNPEFPDITLPSSVENVPIRIIVTEEGHQIAKRRPMLILNMISWLTKDKAEFILVTFKDGFSPQFNCSVYLSYINTDFKLDSIKIMQDVEYRTKN